MPPAGPAVPRLDVGDQPLDLRRLKLKAAHDAAKALVDVRESPQYDRVVRATADLIASARGRKDLTLAETILKMHGSSLSLTSIEYPTLMTRVAFKRGELETGRARLTALEALSGVAKGSGPLPFEVAVDAALCEAGKGDAKRGWAALERAPEAANASEASALAAAQLRLCARERNAERALYIFKNRERPRFSELRAALSAVATDFHLAHTGYGLYRDWLRENNRVVEVDHENGETTYEHHPALVSDVLDAFATDGDLPRAKRFWAGVYGSVASLEDVDPVHIHKMMSVFNRHCWELQRKNRFASLFGTGKTRHETLPTHRISDLEMLLQSEGVFMTRDIFNDPRLAGTNLVEDDASELLADAALARELEDPTMQRHEEYKTSRFEPHEEFNRWRDTVAEEDSRDASYLKTLETLAEPYLSASASLDPVQARLQQQRKQVGLVGKELNRTISEAEAFYQRFVQSTESGVNPYLNSAHRRSAGTAMFRVYANARRLRRMIEFHDDVLPKRTRKTHAEVVAVLARCKRHEEALERVLAARDDLDGLHLVEWERPDACGALVEAAARADDLALAVSLLEQRHNAGAPNLPEKYIRTFRSKYLQIYGDAAVLPPYVRRDAHAWRKRQAVSARKRKVNQSVDAKRRRAWTNSRFATRSRANSKFHDRGPAIRNDAIEEKDRVDVGLIERDFEQLRSRGSRLPEHRG